MKLNGEVQKQKESDLNQWEYDPYDPYGEYYGHPWGAYCLEEEELKKKEEGKVSITGIRLCVSLCVIMT